MEIAIFILSVLLVSALFSILYLVRAVKESDAELRNILHEREELINKWYVRGRVEGSKKAYDDIRRELKKIAESVGEDEKRTDI